jgi:hypothetical protein
VFPSEPPFRLDQEAVLLSVDVLVDGAPTEVWYLDGLQNAVVFSGEAPPVGAVVAISFNVEGEC